MVDWEDIVKCDDPDELKEMKLWLFKEILRLESVKTQLQESQDKFIKERVLFHDEMDKLNRHLASEQKRLKEENMFFEKKLSILQAGFFQLEAERKEFEKEKRLFQVQKKEYVLPDQTGNSEGIAAVLFRNANNPLVLRKRYKDLVKIFHPDNLFGDEELMQAINKEYMRKRKEE